MTKRRASSFVIRTFVIDSDFWFRHSDLSLGFTEEPGMKITVLYGGPSAEREVSLVSGRAVIDGLRRMGHDVFPSDVSPTNLAGLDEPCDVVFPVLHGEFGESGEL